MKRPLFWCSVLFLTGIYLKHFLPQVTAAVLFISTFVFLLITIITSKNLYVSIMAVLISLSLLGGFYAMLLKEAPKQSDSFLNKIVTVKARISDVPEKKEDYCVYYCEIISITNKDITYSTKEKIRLTHKYTQNTYDFGDVFTAKCRLTKAAVPQNRGGFDYGLYLKTKDIFKTGYIINKDVNIISKNNYTLIDYFKLLNIRLCDTIDRTFSEENALFLKAMLLGDKTDMPASYYKTFKNSGLSHVIAVSGMHLSYIVMLLFILQKILRVKRRPFSIFAICFILCFMMLTGMSASVVRAGIMMSFVYIGDVFFRRSDSLTSLGLAAVIITSFNPYALFSSSFILSFAATFGIVTMAKPLEKRIISKRIINSRKFFVKIFKNITSITMVSLSAQIMTMPFAIHMFNDISLWTLPANLLITPFCPLILALGFLFCILSFICMPIALLFSKLLSVIVMIARFIINGFSSMEFGIISSLKTDFLFILVSILIIGNLLLFLYNRKKELLISMSMLVVVLCFSVKNAYQAFYSAEVSFINVGQGDSTIITLPKKITVLIDGGPYDFSDDSDTDSSTICSYLKKKGIRKIDFMIASHPHDDHIGGLSAVLNSFNVGCLIIPEKFGSDEVAINLLNTAHSHNVPIYKFDKNDSVSFGENCTLTALMPDDELMKTTETGNNTSLVLRFDYHNTSFLFPGDAEEPLEKYLTEVTDSSLLDVDVLKVPHHGSKTSTTETLLSKTTPDFAFVPVGKNSFGHPSEEVLKRLSNHSVTVFRADLNRDVIFTLTPNGIKNIIYN